MKPIIALRPEPGMAASIAAGEQLGLTIEGYPMWNIGPKQWRAPDPDRFDALLIGSGNALLHGGPQLHGLLHKCVHAVGQRTAEVARNMGFQIASVGQGGLQQLVDALPVEKVKFLRLAGAEYLPINRPPHVSVEFRVVYETTPLTMSRALEERLRQGALVLLHSGAAARHFVAECDRLSLDRSRIAIAVLGPRIAEIAGEGWAACKSAPQPSDAALLALARDMV